MDLSMSTATQTRTVAEILSENPDLRVMGINRRGEAKPILDPAFLYGVSMEFVEEYIAWTARLPKGIFQQVCIFLPVGEAE